MKTGLTTSMVLHAAVLGFGLISLSAPKPFEVLDVESLPVDLVPVESITQIQQGDKKAAVNEKPTPKPTEKTETVPDAEKVGENKVDTDKKATPEVTQKEVEAAAMPKEAPKPEPKPVEQPEPDPVVEPEPKVAAVPATELMPQPEPKQEVEPDPVSEAITANETAQDAVELPTEAPAPTAKPKPPQAQTAKTPDRKEAEKPVKQAAAKPKSQEKEFDADEVALLLDKSKASGGGAKRSTETASLGGNKTTNGSKLSQSELDALRSQLAGCWALPGAGGGEDLTGLRASIRFNVDSSGKITGVPVVEASSGNRIFDESALRAIRKCDRNGLNLPGDKADVWSEIVVNFDPSDMLF